MFLTCRTQRLQLELFFVIPIVLTATAATVQAQVGKNREPVLAIQRAETDRMLLTSAAPRKESEARRQETIREAKEDFRDIQTLNSKMVAEAWTKDELNYVLISDMIASMREKAARLKVNLKLPAPQESEKPVAAQKIVTSSDFCGALLSLNHTIVRFVTNPVFQGGKTLEISQARKASKDLEDVISLTSEIKKSASRLAKTAISSR